MSAMNPKTSAEFIMESFNGGCMASLHHHHHHHHHHSLHNPHHHHHHHHHQHPVLLHKPISIPHCHNHLCRSSASPLPPTLTKEPFSGVPVSLPGVFPACYNGEDASEAQFAEEEEFQEEEDDEEPIYVMTDEWAEFFAKSEEKRRLEKKQAKKNKKKQKGN